MSAILNELKERSQSKCELCGASNNLSAYEVPPTMSRGAYGNVGQLVETCQYGS